MAWSLQPHNYTQAIRPNDYRVAYRRTGAYKGMGQESQSVTFPWDTPASDSVPCLPGAGPLQPGQSYCSGVVGSTWYGPPIPITQSLWDWVRQNPIPVVIGLAAVFLYLSPGKR
jgi:hypothetical protein